jgi:hypothetical protein
MGQNGFSKMTELSVNATEFRFFRRLLFLSHIKRGRILVNFTKFSENRQDQPLPNFLLHMNFQILAAPRFKYESEGKREA